jgi:hypothetical protein
MKKTSEQDITTRKLDRTIQLPEDIFILQASVADMKRQELRSLVGLEYEARE